MLAVSTATVEALSPGGRQAGLVGAARTARRPAAPRAAGRWLLVPADGGGLRFLELASRADGAGARPGHRRRRHAGAPRARAYVLSNGGRLLALDLR